jgi:hypothetical protein
MKLYSTSHRHGIGCSLKSSYIPGHEISGLFESRSFTIARANACTHPHPPTQNVFSLPARATHPARVYLTQQLGPRGNVPDLNSGGARFESRPGH